jgi:hypothetical protein
MRKWLILIAVFTIAAGSTAVWAIAAQNAAGPATITGCLTKGGQLTSFAVGDAPGGSCKATDTQVALSGGDITGIATPLAGGLSGGTDSGAATLSLQQRFQLPQTCAAGDVIRYSAALQYWACGSALESKAYEVYRQSVPFTVAAIGPPGQRVLTLHVPPGTYSTTTTVNVHKDSGWGLLVCVGRVEPSDQAISVSIQSLGTEPGAIQFASITQSGAGVLPAGGTIELWCRQGVGATGPAPVVTIAGITAVSVANAVATEDTSSGNQYGG